MKSNSVGEKGMGGRGEGWGEGGGGGGGSDRGRGLAAGSTEGVIDGKKEEERTGTEERSNFNYHQLSHHTKYVPKSLFDLNGRATTALFDPLIEHTSQSLRNVTQAEGSGTVAFSAAIRLCLLSSMSF